MEYLELGSFSPPGSLRTACRKGRPYGGPARHDLEGESVLR